MLFEVDVEAGDGDSFFYFIWYGPNQDFHPGATAIQWLNEDEKEDGSGKIADNKLEY